MLRSNYVCLPPSHVRWSWMALSISTVCGAMWSTTPPQSRNCASTRSVRSNMCSDCWFYYLIDCIDQVCFVPLDWDCFAHVQMLRLCLPSRGRPSQRQTWTCSTRSMAAWATASTITSGTRTTSCGTLTQAMCVIRIRKCDFRSRSGRDSVAQIALISINYYCLCSIVGICVL